MKFANKIFNVDKTVLQWEKMLSRTFIDRKQKSMLGFTGWTNSLVRD